MNKNITLSPDAEWMVAYVTYDFHEAHIIAGRLRSDGIPTMVHQQAGANAMGIHIGRLGEIRLLVRPQDYHLALSVLYPEESDALPDDVNRIIFGGGNDDE